MKQRSNSRKKSKESHNSGNTSLNTTVQQKGNNTGSRNSSNKSKRQDVAAMLGMNKEQMSDGLKKLIGSRDDNKPASRQHPPPLLSDFYRSQQQRDITDLMRNLALPDEDDESLTVSTISQQHVQSPFPANPSARVKNTTAQLSEVLRTQYEHSNEGLTTLGRSEEESKVASGTLRQMLGTQKQPETIQSDYNEESEDSPDFNRRQQHLEDSYDLTVSQSQMFSQQATPLSYRAQDMFQSKLLLGKSDRSFADNVQQLNQFTNSSQSNTHRAPESNRRLGNLHSRRENEDEISANIQEESSSSDIESSPRNNNMDASEMSAIDSFAQTHYSKAMAPRRRDNTPSSMTAMTPGAMTADGKSPFTRKMNDSSPAQGDSMSLTPSTYENNGQKWANTTKSCLTANNASQINVGGLNIMSRVQDGDNIIMPGGDNISTHTGAQNRTVQSDNSSNFINKFTAPKRTTDVVRTSRNGGMRDQELESALETGGLQKKLLTKDAYSTLKRATTLDDESDGSFNVKIAQLNIELQTAKGQRQQYAMDVEQRDETIQQLEHYCNELQQQLNDKSEHLEFMRLKLEGGEQDKLARFRQRNLENAMRKIQGLEKENLTLTQRVQQLENQLEQEQRDEKMVLRLNKDEIIRMGQQLDTLQVLIKGKDREALQLDEQYQRKFDKQKQDYEYKLGDLRETLENCKSKEKELLKTQKELQADLSQLYKQLEVQKGNIGNLNGEVKERDQTIHSLKQQISNEREKSNTELKHFKEKCKTLETELEQLRSFQASQIHLNKDSLKQNDYGIKQTKDMFEKKLAKLNEELGKKSNALGDAEKEIQSLKEQSRANSANEFNKDMIERLQRECEDARQDKYQLRDEIQRLNSELNSQRQLEVNIRTFLRVDDAEDLVSALAKASQAIDQVQMHEKEIKRLQIRIEELQRQLVDQVNSSMASMQSMNQSVAGAQSSEFLLKMTMEKEKQNKELSRKLDELREQSLTQDLQVSRLTTDLAHQRNMNFDLNKRLETLGLENQRLHEGKIMLEGQIEDLKERQSNTHKQNLQLQAQITQIREEQLAKIPTENFKIQYDEIIAVIQEYTQTVIRDGGDVKSCIEKIITSGEENLQEVQELLSISEQKQQEQLSQITIEKTEVARLAKSLEQMQSQLSGKETKIEQLLAENQTITQQCDKLMGQIKEVEGQNLKLRQDLDQEKANLRKALRAQETAKSYIPQQKPQPVVEAKDNSEIEKILMDHEEQLSKALQNGIAEGQSLAINTLKSVMMMTAESEQPTDALSTELIQLVNLVKRHTSAANPVQNRMSAAALSNIKHPNNQNNYDLDDSCLLELQDGMQDEKLLQENDELKQKLTQLSQKSREQEDLIQSLELVLNEKEIQINQVSEKLVQEERNVKSLIDELKITERKCKEIELEAQQKIMENEEQARQLQYQIENEKTKLEQEHQKRLSALESQSVELLKSKELQTMEFSNLKREQESKYQRRVAELEQEFIAKLQKAEGEMAKMSEQNKEATVSQLYKRFHEEKEQALSSMKADYEAQLSNLKSDYTQKIADMKKQHEKDLKKTKDDGDRLVKIANDKLKKSELEWQTDKELIERENSQKLEAINSKHKTALKLAQDKSKSETRNQVDQIKNELARAKAEFEREKKKLLQDHSSHIEQLHSDLSEIRIAKDKQEKLFRKKLDEATNEHSKIVTQLEEQLRTLQSNHQQEFARVKERVEVQLREIVKAEVRNEVTEEIECEYKAEVQRLIEKHKTEIEKLRTRQQEQLERVEKACTLPKAHENLDKRDKDVQCDIVIPEQQPFQQKQKPVFNRFDLLQDSPQSSAYRNNNDPDNTGLVVINQSSMYSPSDDIIEYARNPHLNGKQDDSIGLVQKRKIEQDVENRLRQEHEIFVEQLKANYEDELERQQRVFEQQLISRQCQTARVSEELMTLELDKILQSIYLRNEPMKLDSRRREINNLISDILIRTDDQNTPQLKISLDVLKRKVSEVLTSFKQELEVRFQRKLDTAVRESMQSNLVRDSMQIPIKMMGDVRHSMQQQTTFQSEPTVQTQQSASKHSSQESSIKPFIAEYTQETANALKFSEVKNYVTLEDEPNYSSQDPQILRRIAPTINNKGLLTVEVSKVLRDLQMLQRTLKGSKFYKMLTEGVIPQDDSADHDDELDAEQQRGSSHEANLDQYRHLLNSIIRQVVTLNQCADQLTKSQEIYRVKLVNADLRESLTKLQRQIDGKDVAFMSEDIAAFYSGNSQAFELLNQDSQKCLQLIEQSLFSINKEHFKLFQLNELFLGNNTLNRNLAEVNRACSEYVRTHSLEEGQAETLTSSQYSPEKLKLVPEMLSPDEIAQLLASIFSKMSHGNSAFFQQYLQTEDNIRHAEAFFQRFREHLHHNNMPLQVTQRSHDTQMFTKHINLLSENTQSRHHRADQTYYRSESRSNSNPRNQLMNTAVTNVFSQQHLQKNGSIKSFNNMPLQQQQHFQSIDKPQLMSTTTAPTTVSKANHPYQSIQLKISSAVGRQHGTSVDEAQSKVNQLFDKMRGQYNTSAPQNGHPQFFYSK